MFHLLVLNLSFKYMFVFLLACKVHSRSLLWENWPAYKRALFLYTFRKKYNSGHCIVNQAIAINSN